MVYAYIIVSSPALNIRLSQNHPITRHWWFMPVILATWEAEIGRIAV
jgi:hypothetical protein